MPTEKQINQAISDFVMKIFLQERFIELKRQQLSDMDDFEPYVAYNRLVRNQYGGVTSKNLKKFLEENSIIASKPKCDILVDQYNVTGNGILSYKEFLNIVLPKEHPDLRAFVTQRECFEISRDEYLSYDTEVLLSNLLDLEIHLYEALYEEKKKLDILGIKGNLVIEVVNKRNPHIDNVNFTNMKVYLEDCGINAYDSEIISFLRRVDQNDDGIVELCDLEKFLKRFDTILKENNTSRRAIVGTSREIIRERSPCRKIVATKIALVKSKKKKSLSQSRREERNRNFELDDSIIDDKENNILNSERIVDSIEKYKKKLFVGKVAKLEKQPQALPAKSVISHSTPEKKELRISRAYLRSVKRMRQSNRIIETSRDKEGKIKIRDSLHTNLFSSKKNPDNKMEVISVNKSSNAPSTKIMDNNSTMDIGDDGFNSMSVHSNIQSEINVSDLRKQQRSLIPKDFITNSNHNQIVTFNTNKNQTNNTFSKDKSLVYTNTNSKMLDYNSLEYNIFKTEDVSVNNIGEFSIQEKARRASIYINNEDPLIIRKAEISQDQGKILAITKNILNDSIASTSIGKSSVCGIDDFLGNNSIAVGDLEKKVANSEVCLFTEKFIQILKQESKIENLKLKLFSGNDDFCIEDIFKLIDVEDKGQFGFEEFRDFVNTLKIEGAGTRNIIDFFGSFDIQQTCFLTIHEFSRMFYPQTQSKKKDKDSDKNSKTQNKDCNPLNGVREVLQAQFDMRKMIVKTKQLINDNKIDINMMFEYFDSDGRDYTTKEDMYEFLKSINGEITMQEVEFFISRCTYGEDVHELSFKEFYIFFSL